MRRLGRPEISYRRADLADCDLLSDIHSTAFRRGWSSAEFEALLVQPGIYALLALWRTPFRLPAPAGFILYRLVRDQAEILSVAVVPDCRRRGVGRRLLEEALRHLYREGASAIHLEVEDTNLAALGLYRGLEFREAGMRPRYYQQGRGKPGGALVMLRRLR
jgi:ribosomal-protein-alanine N-acetyltransferase